MSHAGDRPRSLVLNAASSTLGASFGLLDGDAVCRVGHADGRGAATTLPTMLRRALAELGWSAASLGTVAVVVGPGSFTALRASLALAHGLALAGDAILVGVTVGEALAPALRNDADGDPIWCTTQARRDRVFIESLHDAGAPIEAAMLDALPAISSPVLLGGDAAPAVADALLRRGSRVRQSNRAAPSVDEIAATARRRLAGVLPPRPAQPLYVDPPEARLPGSQAFP